MQKSIVEILDAFRKREIELAEAKEGLQQHKQRAEAKKQSIARAQVPAADQEQWNDFIGPGLEVSFQGIVGAASEGLVYLETRDDEAFKVAVALAAQAVEIMEVIELRLGLVSKITQLFVEKALNPHEDVVAMENTLSGTAESSLSFLD